LHYLLDLWLSKGAAIFIDFVEEAMKLFLDDERFPPNDGADWQIVRTYQEACDWIDAHGIPSFISFDHDLGDQSGESLDGYRFAWYLINVHMNQISRFPDDFDFYVHSQNPVGTANIENLLKSFLGLVRKGER